MSNTWFISDTHLGHANVIRYCKRPFASVEEMDAVLIRNWQSCVGPDDDVYHLGDFAFLKPAKAAARLAQLPGHKHFVYGNHDPEEIRNLPGWASSQPLIEISGQGFTSKIVLCHYAMRVWNKSGRGSWMLYGHAHGCMPGDSQSMDVGVDCHGYRPISIKEVARKLARLPAHVDPRAGRAGGEE